MNSKTCTKCGEVKDLSSFYKHKGMPFGLMYDCKDCSLERSRAWREKNREHIRLYNKKRNSYTYHYNKNYARIYYERHRPEIIAKVTAYRIANKETMNEAYNRKTELLTDSYIKKTLCANSNLLYKDISKELIELKRSQLKLRRECQ